jgi:methionyl-tRNA synthetase
MTARYAGAQVPEPGPPGELEIEIAQAVPRVAEKVDRCLRRCQVSRALEAICEFLDSVNRYLETRAPWQAAKAGTPESDQLVATTLYTSCEALRVVALLIAPFLPEAAPMILERIGVPGALETARLPDDAARWGVLRPGTPTQKGKALFPRIEPVAVEG